MTILGSAQAGYADWLQRTGAGILRWSLVFLLIFFGALKWTTTEAQGIAPFLSHSPFLRWVTVGFATQGASEAIGIVTAPNLGDGAGFLLKDFTLLGAATWLAGEAALTVARRT